MGVKTCSRCGEEKGLSEFYNRHRGRGDADVQARCKECSKEHRRNWGKANRPLINERTREAMRRPVARALRTRRNLRYRRKKLGATEAVIENIFVFQGGRCAICWRPFSKTPCLDHDHETGCVRGLLCDLCNTAIGKLRDDTAIIMRALDYVRTGGGRWV